MQEERWSGGGLLTLKCPARREGEAPCFGGSYEPADELTPAYCLACPNRALLTEAGCFASPGQLPGALGETPPCQ